MPTLHSPWNDDIIGFFHILSTSTACSFMVTSMPPLNKPMPKKMTASTATDDGKPIVEKVKHSAIANSFVRNALPKRNASQPVNGVPITAPTARMNSKDPNDECEMPKDSCSSGTRAAQLAYRNPLKKKNAETVMR